VIDKITAVNKLICLGNTVRLHLCLTKIIFLNITEIDIRYLVPTRKTIDILINNLGKLWEAIRVDRLGIIEIVFDCYYNSSTVYLHQTKILII